MTTTNFAYCLWLVLGIITMMNVTLVSATVMYGGYTFESMPSHFGRTWFPPGRNFPARLQFLHGNGSRLCHGMANETELALPGLVIPPDNSPVALLVERGDCSFQDKANMAMKAFPAVRYMVVYDNVQSNNLVSMRESSSADNITLGMLFVSYRAGMALRSVIDNQTDAVTRAGGPMVKLNGLDPLMLHEPSLQDLQTWILIAMSGFFCFIVVFGCILVFVQLGVIPVNGSGQIILTQEAIRRSRRLLSREEVERLQVGGDLHDKVAASTTSKHEVETQLSAESGSASLQDEGINTTIVNSEEDAVTVVPAPPLDPEEEHTCAVCLDDLMPSPADGEEAANLLCLPCGHKFHSNCIVPWMTERHASCPLCKFDVLQFIMDLDEKSSPKRSSRVGASLSWCKERARRMMRVGWSPVQSNDSQAGSSTSGSDDEGEGNESGNETTTHI
ncbi:protein ligase RNF167 [Seminavis robusta]|uniref:Protein ligase RNF167 n=1 Tax=Seminavis robusta TaxID=568900 RepID=A0A9N8ED14_9STRA|nr:protein ligase RNF167 [Seminavis robusta]CAB9516290.1 protein ligase RNF167 [Seminavis robusta]|eukprot:Sro762_g198770.1 protein ligase RNF167 (446) ;mRNA; r:39026-40564